MTYPLRFPDDDPRFSPALLLDVANTGNGPVARIKADPQPGGLYQITKVVPCRELTLIRGGA